MTRNQFKKYLDGGEGVLAQTFPWITEDPYKTTLDVLEKGWKYLKNFIFGNNALNLGMGNSGHGVEYLDAETLTKTANRHGLPGPHVGLYTEHDDRIRVAFDAADYGFDPIKVALHEGAHRAKAKGWVRLPDYIDEEAWADGVAEEAYRKLIGGVKGFI